jgi:hypothetical protein
MKYIVPYVYMWQAGLAPEGRPAGVFLLLGPTGTGKTKTVEAIAELLHGWQIPTAGNAVEATLDWKNRPGLEPRVKGDARSERGAPASRATSGVLLPRQVWCSFFVVQLTNQASVAAGNWHFAV